MAVDVDRLGGLRLEKGADGVLAFLAAADSPVALILYILSNQSLATLATPIPASPRHTLGAAKLGSAQS